MRSLLAAILICLTSAAIHAAELSVGAGQAEITPIVETFKDQNGNDRWDAGEPLDDINQNGRWDPVWLAGNRGGRYATGVHDPLWARAIVISDGSKKIALVSLDLIGYMFDEARAVQEELHRRLGIPKENILIASTHDHSGPDTIGVWGDNGQSGKDPDYMLWLRTRIVQAVAQADRQRKPARLLFAKTRLPGPIDDPRPPRVINDLLLSMRAVDESGATIATLVNYAIHAEVLSEKNRLVTSDFPGPLRREVEKQLGGVALFFPGDVGGMQTPKVVFHTFRKAEQLGRLIAREVVRAQKKAQPAGIDALQIRHDSILFPIENPRFIKAIEAGLFGDTARHIERRNGHLFLPADVAWLKIGPAQFVTFPGEAFPELGAAIRKRVSAEYPFTLGLCNNEIGYILPKDQWHWDGYEESMSLGPETGVILSTVFSNLLSH